MNTAECSVYVLTCNESISLEILLGSLSEENVCLVKQKNTSPPTSESEVRL